MLETHPAAAAAGTAPRHAHNCDRCVFLGRHGPSDVYLCPGGWATVVLRFSSDPLDYASGFGLADGLPEPMRARAVELAHALA